MTTPLADLLRRRIAQQGPITVAAFMAEALGHPRHGYYMRRDPFGTAGDFVTAPEISQMFGELLGLWCAERWLAMGRPAKVALVELGPGRGTLMSDALRAARGVPGFLAALSVHLVETSPPLRAAQRATLATVEVPVAWHDGVESVPPAPMLLLANEFLDALPIRQFVRMPAGWHERMIGWHDGAFHFTVAPGRSPLADALSPAASGAPLGAVAELCPPAIALAGTVAARIRAAGGAALFVDYGHARSAAGDTLQAVRNHRHVPVLEAAGEADITAHVDFEAVARAAGEAGATVLGPVDQGTLLRRLGIETRAATLARAAPAKAAQVEAACRRLIAPGEMGTLFKALAVIAPGQTTPAGFELTAPTGAGPSQGGEAR
ncbi:NADH dehydrogenase [ubiquinone] 1 alpha subcomplex assembly factor 7 [Constrictibacter sp. MBR-5]|uniref:class I SAM-dependent methyltransferase n=1 Tax=Constrictibacter sp. MBR-5 TaxID=3156467 RepID=UPI0033958172